MTNQSTLPTARRTARVLLGLASAASLSLSAATYAPADAVVTDAALDWVTAGAGVHHLFLAQFNPALGQLTAATLSIETLSGTGTVGFENQDFNPCTVSFNASLQLQLFAAAAGVAVGSPIATATVAAEQPAINLTGADANPYDFAGTSGGTYTLNMTSAALPVATQYAAASGADLSAFIGNGQLEFIPATTSAFSGNFPDCYNLRFTSVGSLRLRITYTYEPTPVIAADPVPVPAADPAPAPAPAPCEAVGTATVCFWKRNVAKWPLTMVTLGSLDYSAAQASKAFFCGNQSTPSLRLARQLLATKLNLAPALCNNSGCIAAAVVRADELLSLYTPGKNVPSAVRSEMLALRKQLSEYNKGQLCEEIRLGHKPNKVEDDDGDDENESDKDCGAKDAKNAPAKKDSGCKK